MVKQNMPISTAIGMEKLSKYYICFVKGGVLRGDVETIPEESVGDISTGSEEERKLERKREKITDKDVKRKENGKTDERRTKRTRIERKEESEERKGKKRLERLVKRELALLKSGR